jgi:hypothetical protein
MPREKGLHEFYADVELTNVVVQEAGLGFSGAITLTGTLIPVIFNHRCVKFVPENDDDDDNDNDNRHEDVSRIRRELNRMYTQGGGAWWPDESIYRRGRGYVFNLGGCALGLIKVPGQKDTYYRVGLCIWGEDLRRELSNCFKYNQEDPQPLTSVTIV